MSEEPSMSDDENSATSNTEESPTLEDLQLTARQQRVLHYLARRRMRNARIVKRSPHENGEYREEHQENEENEQPEEDNGATTDDRAEAEGFTLPTAPLIAEIDVAEEETQPLKEESVPIAKQVTPIEVEQSPIREISVILT